MILAAAAAATVAAALPADSYSEYFLGDLELSLSNGSLTAVEYVRCHPDEGVVIEHSLLATVVQERPDGTARVHYDIGPIPCEPGTSERRTSVTPDEGRFVPDLDVPLLKPYVWVQTTTCWHRENDPDTDEDDTTTCVNLRTDDYNYDLHPVP